MFFQYAPSCHDFANESTIYECLLMHSDFDDEDLDEDGTLISDEEEDNESGFLSQH